MLLNLLSLMLVSTNIFLWLSVIYITCCHAPNERSFTMSSKHKNKTISFRITEAERKQIEARIIASGMMKKDYFIRSCIYNYNCICVVGKKETIYPLVQTVNALYLQLLEMQKAFTSSDRNIDMLPSSDAINELQTEYTNMLTAITDLLDGAKYLWKGKRTISSTLTNICRSHG